VRARTGYPVEGDEVDQFGQRCGLDTSAAGAGQRAAAQHRAQDVFLVFIYYFIYYYLS
jgi:hypothetical protein